MVIERVLWSRFLFLFSFQFFFPVSKIIFHVRLHGRACNFFNIRTHTHNRIVFVAVVISTVERCTREFVYLIVEIRKKKKKTVLWKCKFEKNKEKSINGKLESTTKSELSERKRDLQYLFFYGNQNEFP